MIIVTVTGPVACGKSAIAGEIEIALRAIGVPVRFADEAAAESERRMTHADWQEALALYRPSVSIQEVTCTDRKIEAACKAYNSYWDDDHPDKSIQNAFRAALAAADAAEKFCHDDSRHDDDLVAAAVRYASKAYDWGRRTGRHDAFGSAIKICGQISAKHEGEQSPLAFHAAEECCKALRELWGEGQSSAGRRSSSGALMTRPLIPPAPSTPAADSRRTGQSRLVYDKAKRTIVTVASTPEDLTRRDSGRMSIKAEIEELLGPNVVDDYWVRDSVVLLLRAELARQIEAERQAKPEVPDHAPTPRP